jgi:hypothetical protein
MGSDDVNAWRWPDQLAGMLHYTVTSNASMTLRQARITHARTRTRALAHARARARTGSAQASPHAHERTRAAQTRARVLARAARTSARARALAHEREEGTQLSWLSWCRVLPCNNCRLPCATACVPTRIHLPTRPTPFPPPPFPLLLPRCARPSCRHWSDVCAEGGGGVGVCRVPWRRARVGCGGDEGRLTI